jgi:hypothetical protein
VSDESTTSVSSSSLLLGRHLGHAQLAGQDASSAARHRPRLPPWGNAQRRVAGDRKNGRRGARVNSRQRGGPKAGRARSSRSEASARATSPCALSSRRPTRSVGARRWILPRRRQVEALQQADDPGLLPGEEQAPFGQPSGPRSWPRHRCRPECKRLPSLSLQNDPCGDARNHTSGPSRRGRRLWFEPRAPSQRRRGVESRSCFWRSRNPLEPHSRIHPGGSQTAQRE